eukprot:7728753-Ditylum_brightwellii.AAC.1
MAKLTNIVLPEFDTTKIVDKLDAHVFDSPCAYNVILGQDFLCRAGLNLNTENGYIKWMRQHIQMRSTINRLNSLTVEEDLALYNDDVDEEEDTSFVPEITEAKRKAVSPDEVAEQQKHLTPVQCEILKKVLEQTPILFYGKLGCYPHKKIKLELQKDVRPYHAKTYLVPRIHQEIFKKELKYLVEMGVLRPCGPTEWAAGTFIIPKKDGRVRWVSDFRELNKALKQIVYPIPIIQE